MHYVIFLLFSIVSVNAYTACWEECTPVEVTLCIGGECEEVTQESCFLVCDFE